MKPISETLRELRAAMDMTQSKVAEKIGLNTNAYQSYERGVSEPSCKILNNLAELYGVSVDYLLGRVPPPENPDPFKALQLNDVEKAIVRSYIALKPKERDQLIELLKKIVAGAEIEIVIKNKSDENKDGEYH